MAASFHCNGPLARGPFVYVDCRRGGDRLRRALEGELTGGAAACGDVGPIRAAWGGTLYLDDVTALDPSLWGLLRWLMDRTRTGPDSWPLRLGAGMPGDPALARHAGFPADLIDELDKIRVDLDRTAAA